MASLAFDRAIRYSENPDVIRDWAASALADGLHREDGLARFSLARPESIRAMAVLPGVSWVFHGDEVLDEGGRIGPRSPRWQAFTRPDMRRRGIASKLWAYALGHHDARGLISPDEGTSRRVVTGPTR